jgi:4a-hydroxytetrahydrobiopterin dehydratase
MTTRLTPDEFNERFDLPGWQIVNNRLEIVYRAPTYEAAARLVLEIARAAEAAVHHPDLDLRYPGRVHVYLTTHAVHGLTELDGELAATISELAAGTETIIEASEEE